MASPRRRTFSQSFAAVTSVIPFFRPGTDSASPLLAAPLVGQARHEPSRRLRRSMRICTAEGMVAEVVTACAGGAVLTGWALHLGCSPLVIGLIAALPQMAQLIQIPAAWCTSFLGHRRACLWMVGLSRQALLPMIALPFLPVPDAARQTILVLVAALSAVLGVMGNNAWVAWMGELIPRRVRGRYFGRRTGLCMLGGALASAGAGLLLDRLSTAGMADLALSTLAGLACLAGVVTSLLMIKTHDPAPLVPRARFDLQVALRPFRDEATRGLLGYQLVWNFAVGIAASYFTLHMLDNLHMGFTLVAIHATTTAVMRMLFAPLWGRAIDAFGARPVLLACSLAIPIIPLIWIFPTPWLLWPICFEVVLTGFLWSGHALAVFALPLSVAPRQGRPFYLAAFAMVGGVAFSVATLLGGLVAQALPPTFTVAGHPVANLQVLFVVTAIARFAAALYGLRIVEPKSRPLPELFRALPRMLMPARTRASE